MSELTIEPPLERRYFGFAGLPGRGPWAISAYCSARNHNSLNAARRTGQPGGACTCPRALALLKEWKQRYGWDAAAVKERSGPKLRKANPEPITATVPSFADGLCTTEGGRSLAVAGMNESSTRRGIADRADAVRLCNAGPTNAGPCPIRDSVCRPWVLSQESPAGSWGGVWGGLDPWQRQGKDLIWNQVLETAEVIDYVID